MTRINPADWKRRVEAIEAAARRAAPAPTVLIVNDPESETLFERYRLGLNDTSQTIEIGQPEFPCPEWYAAYQEAARSDDHERALDLLRRGAAALLGPSRVREQGGV
jgi:hypothetical protein